MQTGDFAIGLAIKLRDAYTALDLRALARKSKGSDWTRRLLSLSVIHDGRSRSQAVMFAGGKLVEQHARVRQRLLKNGDLTLDEWRAELEERGVSVDRSTVCRVCFVRRQKQAET